MKRALYKLRMLIVGGALFMVPFLLLFILLSKAHEILKKIISPVSEWLPINSVIGLETPWLFATFLLVLLCLVFGLFAKTTKARNMVTWLETTLLSHLPGYSFMKNLGDEYAGDSPTEQYHSVLVRFDDYWQIAFLVERISGGKVVIYVPGSPKPWSGDVFIVEEQRISLLDEATTSAVKCLQKLGEGTGALVAGKL